ncbi:conserved hypothetical protein [Ricinus communis]|uniref:Uncharacterized protein n=1 Tax=Ricinus communis TaxID=3988 RepID=B9SL64_RICCO|nr:conserved hypothetical protein [Ricinus communis]
MAEVEQVSGRTKGNSNKIEVSSPENTAETDVSSSETSNSWFEIKTKRQRTKTKIIGVKRKYAYSPVRSEIERIMPQWGRKKRRNMNKYRKVSPSPTSLDNPFPCISGLVIPGIIPDLDSLVWDDSIFVDFFKDIPEFED